MQNKATIRFRQTERHRLSRYTIFPLMAILLSLPATGADSTGKENKKQKEVSLEYKVKAAFLINFAKFTKWPKESFENAKSKFTIGIIGNNPFDDYLEKLAAKKTIHGRGIEIKTFKMELRTIIWQAADPDDESSSNGEDKKQKNKKEPQSPSKAETSGQKNEQQADQQNNLDDDKTKKEITLDPSLEEKLNKCHLLFICQSVGSEHKYIIKGINGKPVLSVGEQENFATDGGNVNFFIEKKKVRFEINPDATKRANLTISSKLLKLAKIVKDLNPEKNGTGDNNKKDERARQ